MQSQDCGDLLRWSNIMLGMSRLWEHFSNSGQQQTKDNVQSATDAMMSCYSTPFTMYVNGHHYCMTIVIAGYDVPTKPLHSIQP